MLGHESPAAGPRQEAALPPCIFVALAEQTGLIGALGEHVLRLACQEAAGWRPDGGPPPAPTVNARPCKLVVPGYNLKRGPVRNHQDHRERLRRGARGEQDAADGSAATTATLASGSQNIRVS